MERIRTRIIIAVAERLSGAKDSNAKTELIEELSENLYQRYLDLAASGVSEEEAYVYTAPSLHWTANEEKIGYISVYKLDAIEFPLSSELVDMLKTAAMTAFNQK